ncbi:hypothetical protein [Actinotalea solisilvae]|uniref:hypothetical protein n=1 Tax=Actinotalea solisilvae TaxID=2072922 RepID=UPI0018F277CB|nr:hypothetical protein [Actinotalea solisilvae]
MPTADVRARTEPTRARPRRAGTAIAVGVLIAVLAAVAAVTWLRGNPLGGPVLTADSPEVRAALDEARPRAEAALEEAVDGPVADALPVDHLGAVTDASCTEGQQSWKYSDPWDLSCRSMQAVLLQLGSTDTFRADMEALHASFLAAGWEEDGTQNMLALLAGYWDDREQILGNSPGMRYPSDIPSTAYRSPGGETVAVGWLQPEAGMLDAAPGAWSDDGGRTVGPDELRRSMPPGSYALVLSVGFTYFQR